MSGFDKIGFDTDVAKTKQAGLPVQPMKQSLSDQKGSIVSMNKRKKIGKISFRVPKKVWIAVGVVAILLGLMGIPAYATYQSGLKTYRESKLIGKALNTQNITLASDEVDKTKKYLKETQNNFRYLLPLKFVPLLNWYYNDAEHVLQAGVYGLDTVKTALTALEPHADILGLKGEGSFSGGSAEDRIRTAVLATSKITPEIDKIAASLEKVQKEIDGIQTWHYPSLLFGKKIHDGISALKDTTDEAATFTTDAKPLVKALPSLMGEAEEKKYLILFQNDKELRPTGGFITAYAVFRVDKGVIHIDRSDDMYKLDDSIPSSAKSAAPEALQKYLKVNTLNLRDTNISPDFITSMDQFRSLYDKASAGVKVDGIIALDTDVLVKTIKILDDQVEAGGMTFTTKQDPRCDCPQVIYELENNISRPVGYIRSDRKSIIGDLLNAILVKALSSSPKIYWGPLFQTLIAETNQKHILFDLYDTEAQKGIYALNAAGRIKDVKGDYLHINESNFSGAKVNIFLKHTVDTTYAIAGDGTITKTVTINYKNPYPASDCNLERGGLCLNAQYKGWVRIYVPKGSELVDSKGSTVKVTTYDELDKTVFDGLASVRTEGVGSFSVTYKLPFKMDGRTLPLLIQKQPGLVDPEYTISVNGKKQESFPLLTDKELEVRK
jgi:hypothetical protein